VCVLAALLATGSAFASQPPLVDDRPDVCANPGPGDSVVEARIVSFEQPRYDCGPSPNGVQRAWLDLLVSLDPSHAPLGPTRKTGCLFGDMSATVDDRLGPRPPRIDLRVDRDARTVPFDHVWALCGLAPGHHTVETATDRGPLVCASDVSANEWQTVVATWHGGVLHLEPLRIVAGRQRALEPVAVEYYDIDGSQTRFDGAPRTAMLRIWTETDGVLRAQPCLHPERVGAHATAGSAVQSAPSPLPGRSGCAHCTIAGDDVSGPTTFLLLALAVACGRRRRM
jgi:MYXO-CTERM domain-containing protein